MQLWRSKPANEKKRLLIVANDSEFVHALMRALQLPCRALSVSSDNSVTEILKVLQDESSDADVLYLDAQLSYQECPDASYYGGLQLVQHIRLTPSLGRLSLLPIVIGTVDTPMFLIRQSVDNIIVFSPGCEVVKLPTLLDNLCEALQRCQPFTDYEQMSKSVRPFVLFTEGDERACEHAYRNRAGVGKFLKEFALLSENSPGYLHYEGIWRDKLWFKKAQFLQLTPVVKGTIDEGSVSKSEVNETKNHRYIYIDDEHWLGWSYGLYVGLFEDAIDFEVFDKGRSSPYVQTPDGRLICFSEPESFERFINDERQKMEGILKEWSEQRLKPKAMGQLMQPLPYSLIFLDLRLKREDEDPGRKAEEFTGIQLLRQIKEAFPEVPVIIVTASRDERSAREARKWGADGYWIKNISTGKELMDTIIKCLRKTELRAIWRAIRMIEEKEELVCYEWNASASKLKERVLPKKEPKTPEGRTMSLDEFKKVNEQSWEAWRDRRLIMRWLRESFWLLWEGEEVRNPNFHDEDYPYDRVILNMGLIQELRLKGLDERHESRWKGVYFREYEMKLRHRRNDMVHSDRGGNLATPEEAIAFFKFTINRLLDCEIFPRSEWENTIKSCIVRSRF